MGDVKLVIQSDDFGMCHSGNIGVVEAFRSGVLTQASVMVACPWFHEAARLAKEHSIPVGVHLMTTAEWEFFRWGPLTGGASLRGDDGRFPKSIEEVQKRADPDEIFEEFVVQVELFRSTGLEPEYFDCHMGIVTPEPYREICRRYDKPFDYPIGDEAVGFDSIHMLSSQPGATKNEYLLDRISKMGPGKHLVVSHCAVESSELRSMTTEREGVPDHLQWALEYRVTDLATLTSDEIRKAIEECDIDLVSVGRL
jgi:predicted glycoside hydrolase/deacetylase ChbG (UPF0249 family)